LNPTAQADIRQKSMSLFANQEFVFSSRLRMEAGLRGDYFIFDLEDRLRDSTAGDLSGYVQQTIVSPKANLVFSPVESWQIFLNGGGGFHSNDARVAVTRPGARTLPRAWGAEIGSRVAFWGRLILSAAAWGLDLQNEFVYVGDEGTTEVNGPTRRYGLDLDGRLQIAPWLWGDADLNVSRGRFKELPAGENRIPLAPTFTSTGGITARHPSGLEGAVRYRFLDDRAANEDNSVTAMGYTLLDVTAGYRFSRYKIGFSVENLLNVEWNEAQFDTESRLSGEVVPVSGLHFTPGVSRNIKTSFSVLF
jgi:hypothetical protein